MSCQGGATVSIPNKERAMFEAIAELDQQSALRWIVQRRFFGTEKAMQQLIRELDAYTSAKYREGYEEGRVAAWSAL